MIISFPDFFMTGTVCARRCALTSRICKRPLTICTISCLAITGKAPLPVGRTGICCPRGTSSL